MAAVLGFNPPLYEDAFDEFMEEEFNNDLWGDDEDEEDDDENERRKRHGEDQEYAENYEDFERWRVAGDLSPGHGYNFLIAHLHAAHSLLAERFRDTVGMSKASFNDLERDARATGYFVDDTVQRFGRPKPIKLDVKLMYCLVRLRKGNSFLSLEEPFGISRSVGCAFFNTFCRWISQERFEEQVYGPRNEQERDEIESIFRNLGHNGCVGMKDGVHFPSYKIEDYAQWLASSRRYDGRTFCANVTVGANGVVQYTTPLFFGNTNDAFINSNHDEHYTRLNDPDDIFFTTPIPLVDAMGNPVIEHGNYVLCDNGYDQCPAMICPAKLQAREFPSSAMGAYSRQHESDRKQIECVFGIVKREFLMFRNGVEVENVETVQHMWRTALWLHNLKIRENGYEEAGFHPDDYEGPIQRVREHEIEHYVVQRINDERQNLERGQALVLPNPPIAGLNDNTRRVRFREKRTRIAENFYRRDFENDVFRLRTREEIFEAPRT